MAKMITSEQSILISQYMTSGLFAFEGNGSDRDSTVRKFRTVVE